MVKMDFDRLLLSESPDAVLITTTSGQIVYWNRAAEQIFGYSQEEAVGQQLESLIVPPNYIEEAREIQQEAIRFGLSIQESMRWRKDGALVHISISSKAITGPDGEIAYILSSNKDITQLRLQRDANWVETKYHDLLESVPDAVVIANSSGLIVAVNQQTELLFGYQRGALCGKPIEILLPERFRAGHPAFRSQYFLQPRLRTMGALRDLFGRRKDGVEFPVEISLNLLRADEGSLVMSVIRDISERPQLERERELMRAEASARQAQRRFQQMWETTSDAVLIIGGDNRIRYANPVVSSMFGHNPDSLLGQSLSAIIPIGLRERHERGLKRFLTTKTATVEWRGHETMALHRDGHEFPVEISYSFLDSEPEPLFAGFIRDISARKSGEAKLAESERRFRDMLTNVQLISLMLDRQARVTYCNDYMLQLTGWRREEVMGCNWFEQFLPPPHDEIRSVFVELLADQSNAWHHENEILTKAGERRLIRWSNTVLRSAAGAIVGVASIGEDITERRLAAEALRESEQRFRQVTESIREVFFLVSADQSTMLYVSPAYEQIFGRSCESLYADPTSWSHVIHPDDRERIAEDEQDSNGEFDYRYRIIRPDGEIRWIHARGFPICNMEGAVYRIAGIAEDVSILHDQQHRIVKLNRIYALLSGINSAIVRIHDRESLFKEVCRIAVDIGGFSRAWVGEWGSDSVQLKISAWRGMSDQEVSTLTVMAQADLLQPDSFLGRCRHQMTSSYSNEATSSDNDMLHHDAREHQCQSVIALPLILGDVCIGALVLHAKEAGVFDSDELKLLYELASDISFSIQFIVKEERLNYLIYYDPLTGLATRGLFLENLQKTISSVAPKKGKVLLLVFDLDRFTQINDSFGRHVGDHVLRKVATRLQLAGQQGSSVARLGADTFAVVASNFGDLSEIVEVVERQILEPLRRTIHVADREITVTAHVGVALFPDDAKDPELLLKNAEAALSHGRASNEPLMFYLPALNQRMAERVDIEHKLSRALDKQQLRVVFQPRVDLRSGKMVAAEALLRWHHPQLGEVSPAKFIPVAEECGLIIRIGDWVLNSVCAYQAEWLQRGIAIVPVAVNLSALQLKRGRVNQLIARLLTVHRLNPHHLELELTESAVMKDPEDAERELQAVRELGVHMAMDDFGTGYSSLAHLKRFPFNHVKIDRSFIVDIPHKAESAAIAAAVIAMAHSLKLRVVAEGVETVEQLAFLREKQCDEVQGFYCSKAVEVEAFVALLSAPQLLPVTPSEE